ncbi:ABC-three component system middle component 2 [Nocardioides abyssi]|uniref:Threonine transporter n=1 Tax=Nocardioides abyssi TaxID=3058370 RepID=A0ABT8EZG3_9ACTN|nr:ABC-three component system middle component 2 [Nocardioides abyssi]MDN4163361.1 hypothetical protein [Nocardioides abyssi]
MEVGIRSLFLLQHQYPNGFDLGQLVLLDHCVIHAGDLGGPPSVHPELPSRAGELGIKRTVVQRGLGVLYSLGLVDVRPSEDGILFFASEDARQFLRLLTAAHAGKLDESAAWAVETFAGRTADDLRDLMGDLMHQRSEEFYSVPVGREVS